MIAFILALSAPTKPMDYVLLDLCPTTRMHPRPTLTLHYCRPFTYVTPPCRYQYIQSLNLSLRSLHHYARQQHLAPACHSFWVRVGEHAADSVTAHPPF